MTVNRNEIASSDYSLKKLVRSTSLNYQKTKNLKTGNWYCFFLHTNKDFIKSIVLPQDTTNAHNFLKKASLIRLYLTEKEIAMFKEKSEIRETEESDSMILDNHNLENCDLKNCDQEVERNKILNIPHQSVVKIAVKINNKNILRHDKNNLEVSAVESSESSASFSSSTSSSHTITSSVETSTFSSTTVVDIDSQRGNENVVIEMKFNLVHA
ncbi:hypothetical protein PACTADRAFT_32902 [Pachysolen tannophilus NRRL Y-2460]|uniref:Uncharacterized protein n=1 Tax=Pachysolen tannophilus NRRL Y-2460 TaxID=669874 RepID=A0A1E4U0C4_PACTA|nr:hypothetical protein PACTADRAFT_32902 [Pachysolen tannophilus NRRL Y-2460]